MFVIESGRFWIEIERKILMEEGDLVVPAVDLGLEPNLTILTQGRPGQQL